MRVYILTEGGKNIGFGHITRCSSIYEAFKTWNINPTLIINGDNSVKSIIKNIDLKIINWLNDYSFITSEDIVIIDSYIANLDIYENISKLAALSVYFDDNNRLDYPKGIIINGLINAKDLNYPKSNQKIYLLGSDFSPLRSEFWKCNPIIIKDTIESVLITTGGNDIRNLTPKLLKFLNEEFSELIKKVIITNSFSNIHEIKPLINESVELYYSPNAEEMLDIMSSVDLAISSSGQTLYELACLGIPTISIGIIDNQKDNIKSFQKIGFIEYAGCWNNEMLFNNIYAKIILFQDRNFRFNKQKNGINGIKSNGSLNIVKRILNEYYIKNSKFREIKMSDCLKIFEISNDDTVRKNSFNSEKIELSSHKKWFKNILNDKSVKFLVLEHNDDIIGQIRFNFDKEYPVVSISLNKKYRGLGLSKSLLKQGLNYFENDEKIIAYIKPDNYRSISLFESMNFKLDSEVIIHNNKVLKFIRS